MSNNFMIIKTKKLSAKEVKKKFHDFVDELADGCGPELEQEAESLKKHGDEFIEQLSGAETGGGQYRGGMYRNERGYQDGQYRDSGYQDSGRYSVEGRYRNGGGMYRNGYWKDQDEQHKQTEQRIQEMERQLQEMKMQLQGSW